MKKMIVFGFAVALLAAACGDASDDAGELAQTTTSAVAAPDETTTTEAPDTAPSIAAPEEPIFEETEPKPVPTTTRGDQSAPVEDDVSQPVSHPDANVAIAMTDLVDRFNVEAAAIIVKSVEEVTWSDGSLGCPLPGMRYTQALVNGTRIVLEVNGATYNYHSGSGREPFYCQNPSDPVSGGGGDL